MQIRVADSQSRRDGFRLTPLRMCSCGWGLARACLSCVPWSIPSGRPAESRQRRQAFAQRRGDRDSGRARRGFSRPPSGLKWPRGVSSFMTQYQRLPANTSPGVSLTCHPSPSWGAGKTPGPSVVERSTHGEQRQSTNFAFSRPLWPGLGYHSTFQDIPTLGAGGETVKPLRVILRCGCVMMD
jgi:hypothetical protein